MASAYTEAWKPWDDRLADHVIAQRNWQLAFGAMTTVALALTVCVIWLSARIRYVAYAVEGPSAWHCSRPGSRIAEG